MEHLVLFVEDNDTLRYVTTRQLKKLGYAYHYAVNGAEAVRMVAEHVYSIVLMDVMMPEMDGLKATAEIRLIEHRLKRPPVPIIGMTAFYDKERCAEAGMDDCLLKPVLLEDLAKKLRLWLGPNGKVMNG